MHEVFHAFTHLECECCQNSFQNTFPKYVMSQAPGNVFRELGRIWRVEFHVKCKLPSTTWNKTKVYRVFTSTNEATYSFILQNHPNGELGNIPVE